MAKPIIHARSSARRYGGEPEDYLPIHDLMDSSKAAFPDNRHRALTHNSWFFFIVEKIFGHEITIKTDLPCDNCNGTVNDFLEYGVGGDQKEFMDTMCVCNGSGRKSKQVSVRDVCEQHVLEDFGGKFIPTPADYLEGMEYQEWMNNAISGTPTSHRKLQRQSNTTKKRAISLD